MDDSKDRYERATEAARNRIRPGERVADKAVELYDVNMPNNLKSAIKVTSRAFKDAKQAKEDISNYKEFPKTMEGPDKWSDEMIEYWLNYEDPKGYLKGYESFKNDNIGKPKDLEVKTKSSPVLGLPEPVYETKNEWSEDDLKHYYVDLMRQLYDKDYWYENYRANRFNDKAKKIDDRVESYLSYSGLSYDEEKALRDKVNNAKSVQEQLDIIKADELNKEKERIKAFITGRRKNY